MNLEVLKTALMIEKKGLVKGSWGNVSVRQGNKMWITPSGIPYSELKENDIVEIDLNTEEKLKGDKKPSSEMKLHRLIYLEFSEINAVVHTHSVYASAFAASETEIPCYIEDQAQIIGGRIPVAEYALPGTEELAQNAVKVLKEKEVFATLLANHGVVAIGRNLKEALMAAEIVEKAAQIAFIINSQNLQAQELSMEEIKLMRKIYLEKYSSNIVEEKEG